MKSANGKIAGVVLAGGNSRRMGENKSLIQWEGKSLLELQAEKLWACCESVYFSSGSNEPLPVALLCVPDKFGGKGPMDGIASAFHASDASALLVLAVDLPGVSLRLLRGLCERFAQTGITVAAKVGEFPQPLCAIYPREALPILEKALTTDNLRMMELLKSLHADSLSLHDFHPPIHEMELFNVNLPEEWRKWQQWKSNESKG
jgi:molybdenum cofactor guanylyltransferase